MIDHVHSPHKTCTYLWTDCIGACTLSGRTGGALKHQGAMDTSKQPFLQVTFDPSWVKGIHVCKESAAGGDLDSDLPGHCHGQQSCQSPPGYGEDDERRAGEVQDYPKRWLPQMLAKSVVLQ